MGKNFFVFIVLSISAFSARAGNPSSMIDKAVACRKGGIGDSCLISATDTAYFRGKRLRRI